MVNRLRFNFGLVGIISLDICDTSLRVDSILRPNLRRVASQYWPCIMCMCFFILPPFRSISSGTLHVTIILSVYVLLARYSSSAAHAAPPGKYSLFILINARLMTPPCSRAHSSKFLLFSECLTLVYIYILRACSHLSVVWLFNWRLIQIRAQTYFMSRASKLRGVWGRVHEGKGRGWNTPRWMYRMSANLEKTEHQFQSTG